MAHRLEQFVVAAWNRIVSRRVKPARSELLLGRKVNDGQPDSGLVTIPEARRTEHIAILGKTGSGKSSLLKNFLLQDIEADRGFVFFDLHGDTQSFLLAEIARQEELRNCDLSNRLIVIEPGDTEYSVGLNVIEPTADDRMFVQISEFAQILKTRWGLDTLGARTEELLRNSLHVLSDNHLTLIELPALLTHATFRTRCLQQVTNPDVRAYFEARYDTASAAMQSSLRDPVLNKVTGFIADPHFRHILGQERSTFSLAEAMERGYWIILNLDKGRLGDQASTLGSLFLAKLKNTVFKRKSRKLFTLYCDELQNLAVFESGMDTLFSESRKFGLSVCSANQYLDQYPPPMKAAILAVGTHILFQLSSDDATRMAAALGGGRQLGELLRYLRHRQIVVKSDHHRWKQALVAEVRTPQADPHGLYQRCRKRWARPRLEVERSIKSRSESVAEEKEALDDWN